MFLNINGLPVRWTHSKNENLCEFIKEMQVDICGLSKVNVAWSKVSDVDQLHQCTKEWYEARHVSLAWNTMEPPLTVNQVGGVALLSMNRSVYHVKSTGSDPWDLGCWTRTRFQGKQGRNFWVVICYQPVKNESGPYQYSINTVATFYPKRSILAHRS